MLVKSIKSLITTAIGGPEAAIEDSDEPGAMYAFVFNWTPSLETPTAPWRCGNAGNGLVTVDYNPLYSLYIYIHTLYRYSRSQKARKVDCLYFSRILFLYLFWVITIGGYSIQFIGDYENPSMGIPISQSMQWEGIDIHLAS